MSLHSVCNDCYCESAISSATMDISVWSAPYTTSLHSPQITDGCDGYKLGDTQFTFQLSVDVLNDDTTGFYSVSFTNAGGSTAVEETFVTPFGKEDSS